VRLKMKKSTRSIAAGVFACVAVGWLSISSYLERVDSGVELALAIAQWMLVLAVSGLGILRIRWFRQAVCWCFVVYGLISTVLLFFDDFPLKSLVNILVALVGAVSARIVDPPARLHQAEQD